MSSIDEQIEQAMRDGKFDNLPGKGKPFRWDENPNEDPEMALTHHLLKNSGYSLPWIEKRQQLLSDLVHARQALARSWHWRLQMLHEGHPSQKADEEWLRATDKFRKQIAALNKRIMACNLETPNPRFEMPLCNAEQELANLIHST